VTSGSELTMISRLQNQL